MRAVVAFALFYFLHRFFFHVLQSLLLRPADKSRHIAALESLSGLKVRPVQKLPVFVAGNIDCGHLLVVSVGIAIEQVQARRELLRLPLGLSL